MKKLILKINAFIILLLHYNGFTQITIDTSIVLSYDTLHQIYKFKPNLNLDVNDLVTNHKSNFRLMNNSNTLLKTEDRNDSMINGKFYRYTQQYNNIPVEKSMFNVTYNSQQNPVNANGNIYNGINIGISPSISGSHAISNAMMALPATTYYWQDSTMEATIKEIKNDTLATYYPVAELVILPLTNSNTINYYLSYKIRIGRIDTNEVIDVFVDANNGAVLYKNQISSSCSYHKNPNKLIESKEQANSMFINNSYYDVNCSIDDCQQGTANLHKYGSQFIKTDKFKKMGDCKYRLKDNCTGTTLYTKKSSVIGSSLNGSVDIIDNTNNWTNGGEDQDGTTAHWSLERAHDYFRTRYGRNGWENNFGEAQLFTNNNGAGVNGGGLFNGSAIFLTKKGSSKQHPLIFLDVVGHEFTHGITFNTAKLFDGGQESKALNEGFSDIFGTIIEFYGIANYNTGQSANYLIGELTSASGTGDRDLSDPNSVGDPNTYLGNFWSTSSNNDVFSHINNGVLNFWFFLIAEGGSGTNDNGSNYCISALGRDKAIDIAWVTLTTKLTPNSDYNNCRALSILATEQLYGVNSNEVAQVTNAWYAVGVGSKFAGVITTQNITVNSQYDIHHNTAVSLQNITVNNGPLYVTSNTEIELLPNININQNSVADLYITPYDCSLGARFSNTNGGSKNTASDNNTDLVNSKINNNLQNQKETAFNVQPNPNNGTFKLTLNNNNELPKTIVIRDALGKEVKTIQNPTEYEYNFNLNELSGGLYIINGFYTDKTISTRFIKN
jgi:bacillolysin